MSKAKNNRGGYPKYQLGTWKGKHVVRKFTGFDHHWAEYSKPIVEFDTKLKAEQWIKNKLKEEVTA